MAEAQELATALKGMSLEKKDEIFYGPLLQDPTTLDEEEVSPITLLDNRFLRDEYNRDKFASMYARANKWCKDAGVTEEDIAKAKDLLDKQIASFNARPDAEFDRIFIRDGERSFNTPKRRVLLCHILTLLQDTTLEHDYHQGLSMIVSFLLFFLEAPKVIAMVFKANSMAHYVPGVWKAQSVVSATDGYVLQHLITDHFPEVHATYKRIGIIPEFYASKIWCAFGIHVLPFQSLVVLFDEFWAEGSVAMFRLALTMVARQEEAINSLTAIDRVLELLRFDPIVIDAHTANRLAYAIAPVSPSPSATPEGDNKATSDDSNSNPKAESNSNVSAIDWEAEAKEFAAVRKRVNDVIATLEGPKLLELRATLYEKHLKSRVETGNKDFAAAAVPDCASKSDDCPERAGKGDYYCMDCKVHMCEACAYSTFEGHNEDEHEIRMNEDVDVEGEGGTIAEEDE